MVDHRRQIRYARDSSTSMLSCRISRGPACKHNHPRRSRKQSQGQKDLIPITMAKLDHDGQSKVKVHSKLRHKHVNHVRHFRSTGKDPDGQSITPEGALVEGETETKGHKVQRIAELYIWNKPDQYSQGGCQ